MKRVTLGMCVYDDFDGVYFSAQANRLQHPLLDAEGELLVIDNHPDSHHGHATRTFCSTTNFIRYIPSTEKSGTSVRDRLFHYADSELVICIDSHVLLLPGAVQAVINFFEQENPQTPILLQGPQVADTLTHEGCQWIPVWSSGMFGKWESFQPLSDANTPHYEIGMTGLGAFACQKRFWPGLNPLFRGFGGEEGYLHSKFRKAGGKTICLPAFKWLHRYLRPEGPRYAVRLYDRIYNYLVGALELGERTDHIIEYFSAYVSSFQVRAILNEALRDTERELSANSSVR